jgi:hypothetical protein
MKTAIQVILSFLFPLTQSFSQNIYTLDLKDASKYTVSCGAVTGNKWSVTNSYCSLVTTAVRIVGSFESSMALVPVSINVNTTGNLDCSEVYPDGAFIRYSINNGPWVTENFMNTCGNAGTSFSNDFKIPVPVGSSLRIMANLVVSAATEKIWMNSGDIVIGKPESLSNWTKRLSSRNEGQSVSMSCSIFPNPSNGSNVNVSVNSVGGPLEVRVFDLMGKEVYVENLNETGSILEKNISFGQKLFPGMYVMVFNQAGQSLRKNFMVNQ